MCIVINIDYYNYLHNSLAVVVRSLEILRLRTAWRPHWSATCGVMRVTRCEEGGRSPPSSSHVTLRLSDQREATPGYETKVSLPHIVNNSKIKN